MYYQHTATRHIIVAGDVPIDLFVYPTSNLSSTIADQQLSHVHMSSSGAALIGELLSQLIEKPEEQVEGGQRKQHQKVHWPSHESNEDYSLQGVSAITELDVLNVDEQGIATFKVNRRRRLDTKPRWQCPPFESSVSDILILQDADGDFANSNEAIGFCKQASPKLLVYRMARPLGEGKIWDIVRNGHPEALLVVVNADDLRAEGIELSYGLSWEKTCEDFVEKIGTNGKLDTLITCANLIVLFGCDAAIFHRGRQMAEPKLIFDPLRTEGAFTRQHLGEFPGLIETFIGGFASFVGAEILPDLLTNIQHSDDPLITFTIPSETISSRSNLGGGKWSILHSNIGDLVQVAYHIARRGTLSAANWIPVENFGSLKVLDRSEIESFRTIFHAVREHLSGGQSRPFNIGIFGSRGSGKSFAAVQVVKAAAASCGRTIRQLRFNLAQFSTAEALSIAFSSVSECALSGTIALVYINGFDTDLQGDRLGWLVHLLLPMHVGQVLDHGEMRNIGPAILLFGSNTTSSLEEFQSHIKDEADKMPRVQEFLSCLDGYVDVIGIDKADDQDEMFPVRRAAVLHALLKEREPKLQGASGISIDDSVLSGLLMVPRFHHGIRSLRTIISTSKVTDKSHFERAALPPAAQLRLHLDVDEFLKHSEGNTLSDEVREHIAECIHETYVKCRREMVKNESQKKDLENDSALVSWDELSEELKESSRAHASDIPRKLRLIFCYLAKMGDGQEKVEQFNETEVEKLAFEEHERWNAERLSKQWHLGERDNLVPSSYVM
ncbi:hypothetical protein ONZ43_g103 [Nemania bipapillata]|uniref:Uncharacterized protein n=1 Tax=Nemania bipapillata TaxID=110536 RepID=A0ACC2J9B6_9PEZI|nr:hypothetical protein ONZ43_g103 [Nemania bipapillata]